MDESLGWIGLMTNVHNMLPTIYARWYSHVTGCKPPSAPAAPLVVGPVDFAAILDAPTVPELVPDFVAEEVGPAAAKAEAQVKDNATTDGTTAKDRQVNRSVASKFVAIPSLGSLIIGIRVVCTPAFDLMHAAIQIGGSTWDRLQYAKNTKNLPREYMGVCRCPLQVGRGCDETSSHDRV
jgi:hypothetical protein